MSLNRKKRIRTDFSNEPKSSPNNNLNASRLNGIKPSIGEYSLSRLEQSLKTIFSAFLTVGNTYDSLFSVRYVPIDRLIFFGLGSC